MYVCQPNRIVATKSNQSTCLQNEDLRPKTQDPKTKTLKRKPKNEDPKTRTSFSYRTIKPEPVKPGQRLSSDTN